MQRCSSEAFTTSWACRRLKGERVRLRGFIPPTLSKVSWLYFDCQGRISGALKPLPALPHRF